MPEGVMTAGSNTVAAPVHDDPARPPEPTAEAPRGWTWDRKGRSWKPRQRGQVLYTGPAAPAAAAGTAASPEDGSSGKDPAPGWMREDQPADRPAPVPFEEVSQAVKDDIAGLAGLVATPILAMIQSVDPYCGGALAQSFEGVLDATLPLICRSEKIVRYFTEDKADWLLWGKLAMALAPVGRAIVEHHVTRTVHLVRDEQTGQLRVIRGRQPGQQEDHLTPVPQPEYDASQYAA